MFVDNINIILISFLAISFLCQIRDDLEHYMWKPTVQIGQVIQSQTLLNIEKLNTKCVQKHLAV